MCSSALIYLSPRRATLLLPEHNSWSIPQTASSFVQPGFFFSTSSSLAIKACLLFLNLLTNKKIIPFALLLLLLLLLLISINSYSYTGLYFMSIIILRMVRHILHTIKEIASWALAVSWAIVRVRRRKIPLKEINHYINFAFLSSPGTTIPQ